METKPVSYRCYHFNNFYLAGIHAGIQAAHAQHELSYKYQDSHGSTFRAYQDWVESHKTLILLNAGMAKDLEELVTFFQSAENPFPWAEWRESEEALNGCITSIAMVLPNKIYENSFLIGQAMKKPPGPGSCYQTARQNVELVQCVDNDFKYTGRYELSVRHSGRVLESFDQFEIDLMRKMAFLKLMN